MPLSSSHLHLCFLPWRGWDRNSQHCIYRYLCSSSFLLLFYSLFNFSKLYCFPSKVNSSVCFLIPISCGNHKNTIFPEFKLAKSLSYFTDSIFCLHYYHETPDIDYLWWKKFILFALSIVQCQGRTGSDSVRISWWTAEGDGRGEGWNLGSCFHLWSRGNKRDFLFAPLSQIPKENSWSWRTALIEHIVNDLLQTSPLKELMTLLSNTATIGSLK